MAGLRGPGSTAGPAACGLARPAPSHLTRLTPRRSKPPSSEPADKVEAALSITLDWWAYVILNGPAIVIPFILTRRQESEITGPLLLKQELKNVVLNTAVSPSKRIHLTVLIVSGFRPQVPESPVEQTLEFVQYSASRTPSAAIQCAIVHPTYPRATTQMAVRPKKGEPASTKRRPLLLPR